MNLKSVADKCKIRVLNNLRKDKDIIITITDYGSCVVVLNKNDYMSKTEDILNDKSTFKVLQGDWLKHTLRLEDKLNRVLRSIKKLPDNYYEWLFASGSSPGVLYGLTKGHKLGCPLDQFYLSLILSFIS